jgi:hypothetical protein
MIRKRLWPALAATMLATTAFAQDATMVREVEVTADLGAVQNPRAAEYWTDIADDLENAIVARLTDRIAEDGVRISVDISEVELANTFENLTNIADTRMVGQVNITSETDNTQFNSYELTLSVEQALPYFPPGTVVTAITLENRDYYSGMIEAFAQSVVDRL